MIVPATGVSVHRVFLPLQVGDQFTGMLAAVVSLDPVLRRLQDASGHQRSVFIVDHFGHVVAHPDTKNFVPGTDLTTNSDLVKQIRDLPQELRNTQTVRFTQQVKGRSVEMVGTFSTMPSAPPSGLGI